MKNSEYDPFRRVVGAYRRLQLPPFFNKGDIVEIRKIKLDPKNEKNVKDKKRTKKSKSEIIEDKEAGAFLDELDTLEEL